MNTTITPEIHEYNASACTVDGGSLMQRTAAPWRMFTLFPNLVEEPFEWERKTDEPMPYKYAIMYPIFDESHLELSQTFDIPDSFPTLPRLEDLDLD